MRTSNPSPRKTETENIGIRDQPKNIAIFYPY